MKKIIAFASLLMVCISLAAQTKVTAPLVRNNSADNTYGTHIDSLGYGGMIAFHDTLTRNSFPAALRKVGMLVGVDTLVYQLQGGIANINWVEIGGVTNFLGPYLSVTGRNVSVVNLIDSLRRNPDDTNYVQALKNGVWQTQFYIPPPGGSVFSTGLKFVEGINLDDTTVTIVPLIIWERNSVADSQLVPSVFEIKPLDSGYYQTILLYIDSTNVIDSVQGNIDTVSTIIPVLPPHGILITQVNIFGDEITVPGAAITSNFWTSDGTLNNITSGTGKIGTSSNTSWRIYTNFTERMRVDSLGRVSIGAQPTVSANFLFDVYGTSRFQNNVRFGGNDNFFYGTDPKIFFAPSTGVQWNLTNELNNSIVQKFGFAVFHNSPIHYSGTVNRAFNILQIDPIIANSYNVIGDTLRAIFVNPRGDSLFGTNYIAFENNFGNVILSKDSGRVGIHNSHPNFTFDVNGSVAIKFDSIPVTTGETYNLVADHLTGQIKKQLAGAGGTVTQQIAFDNSVTAADNPTINGHGNDFLIDSSDIYLYTYGPGGLVSAIDNTSLILKFERHTDSTDVTISITDSVAFINNYYTNHLGQQSGKGINVQASSIEFVSQPNTLNNILFRQLDTVLSTPTYIAAFVGDALVKVAYPSGGGSAWNLTGNSGTDSATNFVGTTDNVSLNFKTNNQTRLTVDNNGNVGIATQEIHALFEVGNRLLYVDTVNHIIGAGFSNAPSLALDNNNWGLGDNANSKSLISGRTGEKDIFFSTDGNIVATIDSFGHFAIGLGLTTTNYSLEAIDEIHAQKFSAGNAPQTYFDSTGIRTFSNDAPVATYSESLNQYYYANGSFVFDASTDLFGFGTYDLSSGNKLNVGGNIYSQGAFFVVDNNFGVVASETANGYTGFFANGTENDVSAEIRVGDFPALYINNSKNVGIGTSSPDSARLVVNGGITTDSIRIGNDWFYTKKITLTPTDIYNAFTTPILAIDLPGVGNVIEIISASAWLEFNTTIYDNDANISLWNNIGDGTNLGDWGVTTFAPANQWAKFNINNNILETFNNQPIYLKATVDNTTGDSPIHVTIYYKINKL